MSAEPQRELPQAVPPSALATVSGAPNAFDVLRERSGVLEEFLSTPPPEIEWVVEGLLPAHVEGGLVAAGGTGKGLFEIMLALHIALGRDTGAFPIPRQRGVVLLALEDDKSELHRRVRASLDVHFPNLAAEDAATLRRNLEIKPLRGVEGASLTDEFVDAAIDAARQVPDVGVVFLDPLTRGLALPEGRDLNTQEGGGITIRQLGRISAATGAAVVFAHHVNKAARREGTELHASAATGSAQLVDLSRVVVNMRELTSREAESYDLDPAGGARRYVEVAVSKSNGPRPPGGGPHVLEVLPQGAVEWRMEAAGQPLTDLERVFEVIVRRCAQEGRPVTIAEIEEQCGHVSKRRAQEARNTLVRAGAVLRQRNRQEQQGDSFEPAPNGEALLASLAGRDGNDGAL